MKKQLSKETKHRIRQLRLYRNWEILNGNLILCAMAMFREYNRWGDKFDILNMKISNLKNGLDEDDGLDFEHYFEPGITDNPRIFLKLAENKQ